MSSQRGPRNRRRVPSRSGAAAAGAPAPGRRPAWRANLDQYGGLTTLVVVGVSLLFIGWLGWQALPQGVSDAEFQGTEVALAAASHTTNAADVIVPEGEPPAGGPHFPVPLPARKYADPVEDGNAIHSLEHGMIWITYNRDMVSAGDVATLEAIQGKHSRDVLLSPRPKNQLAIAVVSWGRILRLDKLDEAAIEKFINVNRDRSPEPGVR